MKPADALNLLLSLKRPRSAAGLSIPALARVLAPTTADPYVLAEFRRVTRYPDDGCLPLTYPQAFAFPTQVALLADPTCPVPVAGMIHVAMRVKQRRPIRGNERFVCTTAMENGRATPRGFEFDLTTTLVVQEEPVWEGIASMLVRGPAPADRPRQASRSPVPSEAVDDETTRRESWEVSAGDIRAYARVSRDFNPIHLSPLTARLFGMKRALAHGMWSLTRVVGMADSVLAQKNLSLDAAFKLPLFVPATVQARVRVVDGATRSLRVLDAEGLKPHVTGTLRV